MLDKNDVDATQNTVAADKIMADIRMGKLLPGHKLKIAELRGRYGIGASPLREALSMVASLGYVTCESHRGYRVAAVSRQDLTDITRAREVIEIGMLHESMLAHTDEWAIGILAAAERLRLLTARCEAGPMRSVEPIRLAHKQLHIALIAGCTSRRLAEMQNLLFDQAARYRDIMLGEVPSASHFFDAHHALTQTILGGDVSKAAAALRAHLQRTLHDVYPFDSEFLEEGCSVDAARKIVPADVG